MGLCRRGRETKQCSSVCVLFVISLFMFPLSYGCAYIYPRVCVCLYAYVYVCVYVCVFQLCMSVCLSPSVLVSLLFCVSICLSVYLPLSLSPSPLPSPPLSPSHSLFTFHGKLKSPNQIIGTGENTEVNDTEMEKRVGSVRNNILLHKYW